MPNPRIGHLRATRLRLGLSQRQVGERVGLLQTYVSDGELGKSQMHARSVMHSLMLFVGDLRIERWLEPRRTASLVADQERVKDQERIWEAVPESPEKNALEDAMIDRCFDLMCEGKGEECDAIAEWLPNDRVQAMFAAWERWNAGDDAQPESSPEPPAAVPYPSPD